MQDEMKHLVQTPGWQIVLATFNETFEDFKKEIKTDGKRYEDIAIELMAKQEAAKMVKRALDKIKRMANVVEIKKESYK